MALFSSSEGFKEKNMQEMQRIIKMYDLDDVDEKDLIIIKKIAINLAKGELTKKGMLLDEDKLENNLNTSYLATLVEQNWLFIKQFDKLNKNMEELLKR